MQTLETSPAHGRDLAAQLSDEWGKTPEIVSEMAEELRDALKSTSERWDIHEKKFIERPDRKARLEAIKLILAYSAGLPLQRSVAIAVNKGSYGDFMQTLREDPDMLAELERQIEKAKFHGRHLKKAAPVDADELPPE